MSPGFIAHYNNEQSFNVLNGHNNLPVEDPDSSPSELHHLGQNASPIYNMDPYLQMLHGGGTRIQPLDSQTSRSARFIGETGESNPYLLRHYRYDENDECTISKLTYRKIKSNANSNTLKGDPPVVFMLADDSMAEKGEPRSENAVLEKAHADINNMFNDREALRLIGLFFRFVYPYFPILSKNDVFLDGQISPSVIHTLPMSLLSAIYAHSLPFMIYDDLLATSLVHTPPSTQDLFRISWLAVTQELHTPRLATLQACLLLLQRPPTNRFVVPRYYISLFKSNI